MPSTGASTNASPCSRANRAHRSVPSSPIVLICSQIASSPAPGSADSAASSTACVSASMVTMTSAPAAASAGEPSTSTPSPASGSAFSLVRFQARTPIPACAMFRAMPDPMLPPAPSTATTAIAELPSSWSRRPRYPPGARRNVTSLRALARPRGTQGPGRPAPCARGSPRCPASSGPSSSGSSAVRVQHQFAEDLTVTDALERLANLVQRQRGVDRDAELPGG